MSFLKTLGYFTIAAMSLSTCVKVNKALAADPLKPENRIERSQEKIDAATEAAMTSLADDFNKALAAGLLKEDNRIVLSKEAKNLYGELLVTQADVSANAIHKAEETAQESFFVPFSQAQANDKHIKSISEIQKAARAELPEKSSTLDYINKLAEGVTLFEREDFFASNRVVPDQLFESHQLQLRVFETLHRLFREYSEDADKNVRLSKAEQAACRANVQGFFGMAKDLKEKGFPATIDPEIIELGLARPEYFCPDIQKTRKAKATPRHEIVAREPH